MFSIRVGSNKYTGSATAALDEERNNRFKEMAAMHNLRVMLRNTPIDLKTGTALLLVTSENELGILSDTLDALGHPLRLSASPALPTMLRLDASLVAKYLETTQPKKESPQINNGWG